MSRRTAGWQEAIQARVVSTLHIFQDIDYMHYHKSCRSARQGGQAAELADEATTALSGSKSLSIADRVASGHSAPGIPKTDSKLCDRSPPGYPWS